MPLIDYTKAYHTDVAGLLGPGDQLLAIVPYRLAHGAEKLERTPEVVERRLRPLPRRLRHRAGDLHAREHRDRSLLWRIIDPDWRWNRIDWDQVIGGTSVAGRFDSLAVGLYNATKQGVGQYGVVTAQRFTVLRKVGTDRFEPVTEVRRADVVYARRKGKLFQRGRVVIGFVDGSYIAVNSGILFTGQARRLVTALFP